MSKNNVVYSVLRADNEPHKRNPVEYYIPAFHTWDGFVWMWKRLQTKSWFQDFIWYHAADDIGVFAEAIDPLNLRDAIYEYAKERKMI